MQTVGDWAQYADPNNGGDLYWYNATTGESSWELPPAVAAAQQGPVQGGEQDHDSDSDGDGYSDDDDFD